MYLVILPLYLPHLEFTPLVPGMFGVTLTSPKPLGDHQHWDCFLSCPWRSKSFGTDCLRSKHSQPEATIGANDLLVVDMDSRKSTISL